MKYLKFLNIIFLTICLANTALADIAKGKIAYDKGDFEAAFKLYMPDAVKGNAAAQTKIGIMFAFGRGISRDYKNAKNWFEKADLQISDGQINAEARFYLGMIHMNGIGVERDLNQAFTYFSKAAERNFGLAHLNLGTLYFNLYGDEEKALMHLQLALDSGVKAAAKSIVAVMDTMTEEQKQQAEVETEVWRMMHPWKQ